MGLLSFLGGEIEGPEGWEIRTELAFLEPRTKIDAPLSGAKAVPKPRANLVIRSVNTVHADQRTALAELVKSQAQGLRALRVGDIEDFSFIDSATGASVRVEFEAAPGLKARQLHVLRSHGEISLHFLATIEEHAVERLEELEGVIRTFQAKG